MIFPSLKCHNEEMSVFIVTKVLFAMLEPWGFYDVMRVFRWMLGQDYGMREQDTRKHSVIRGV